MTSDQERAAPAQQPVADDIVEKLFVDLRGRRYLKWIFSEHGDKCLIERAESGEWITGISLDVQDEIRAEWRRIAAASLASSEPELRAEAAAKLQPVAWRCDECGCASYARMDERKPEGGFGPSPLVRCVNCKKVHNVPAASEPELRAEIVRLTRERDEHERMRTLYVTSAQEEHARAEAAELRVEALSAEVGTARAAAFEEAAQIAEGPIYKERYRGVEGHNWSAERHPGNQYGLGRMDAAAAIRSRAALDKGAAT